MERTEPATLYYDPIYTDGLSEAARFPRTRYRRVHEALEARGVFERAPLRRSPLVRTEDLELVHDRDYVRAFLEGRLDPRSARRIGLRPWTDQIVERTLRLTGGSVAALEALFLEGAPVAGNLGGGTHHAFREEGSGYCVFNDVAICAQVARRDYGVDRVLVVDLDVHQGDGTAAIFRDTPEVFTFSIHCAQNFPFRKQRSDLDVALPEGTDDGPYLDVLEAHLPGLFERHQPELLIYQAGVDPLQEDRLGRLCLTRRGLRARNERVYSYARRYGLPTLVLMGGGYAEPLDPTVTALADVFEQAVDLAQTETSDFSSPKTAH